MTTIFTFCGIALVFITGYNLYIWLDSHENNKQKKVIKVTKSLYHLPKEYRFNDYKYWVDHDGYHNYCHVDGSNGAITMNVRDMRKHDPIFKELNDQYYKAIGHTPQWLRDERKENNIYWISDIKNKYYMGIDPFEQQPLTQQPMTLIEQLRNGEIAVAHDGRANKDLDRVIQIAFPSTFGAVGLSKYYWKNSNNNNSFNTSNTHPNINSIPLLKFIQELDNQTTNMKKTIKYTEAQQIIDLACKSEWQPKLAKLWGADIAMKKDIEVSEELYQEGRKAANKEQNELLDKIFGEDKPQYKVGDYFTVVEEYKGHNGKKGHTYNIIKIYGDLLYFEDMMSVCTSLVKVRPATPEEIKQAQYLPEGTPCFVRDNKGSSWKLAYSDGNGEFYDYGKRSGNTNKWTYISKYSDGLPEE